MELEGHLAELLDAAAAVRERAHSPYSRYPVGAAIRTVDGDLFVGCNVENAAFPEGTCAEAGAIAAMVAGAGPTARIAEIVTVAGGDRPGSPCGGCRQKIREFATPETRIVSTSPGAAAIAWTMAELLPGGFGPDDLPV